MSNRLDRDFPHTSWQAVPPIGPDGLQLHLERGRQLRAEAFGRGLRFASRALAGASRTVARQLRELAHGVAQRPPWGSRAATAVGRLTPRGG